MASVVIGIDGGGTKTKVVCMNTENVVLGESLTGSTNWNSVGDSDAFKNLKDGIEVVLQNSKVSMEQVDAICLGMSGVDRPQDKIKLEGWVRSLLPRDSLPVQIENDAVVALVSGTKKLHGIIIISGTGSIVSGLKDGVKYRAGGWGPLLGDAGGGFSMGILLLQAVTSAEDKGTDSLLKKLTLEHLKLDSAWDLIDWAYNEEKTSWARFAALSSILNVAAEQGDTEAHSILEDSAEGLLKSVRIVYGKAGFEENFPVVLSGGNLTHNNGENIFAKIVKKKLQTQYPSAVILLPIMQPAEAAALLALTRSQ